jgi:hypothetical protein
MPSKACRQEFELLDASHLAKLKQRVLKSPIEALERGPSRLGLILVNGLALGQVALSEHIQPTSKCWIKIEHRVA